MKVAMVQPPNAGNSVRGVGFYAERLMTQLQKLPSLEISWMNFSNNPYAYQKYDIVHFPYFDPFQLTLPPVRITRTIVTVHDMITLKYPKHYPLGMKAQIIWPIQKKILQGVDAIITDSQASKTDIELIIKFPSDKIFVAPLAADPAFRPIKDAKKLAEIRKKFKLPEKFALYVGGVNWNKNVPSLIRACRHDLVLVGKEFVKENVDLGHKELEPLKEILKLSKNNPKVRRIGFVSTEDLSVIYNLATVYVQPSIDEGFGLPVLESLACGTPVISTRGGSLPEVGGTGVSYVKSEDIENLEDAIDKHFSLSNKQKASISEKGLAQAKKFSWEKCAKETNDAFQQVLARV